MTSRPFTSTSFPDFFISRFIVFNTFDLGGVFRSNSLLRGCRGRRMDSPATYQCSGLLSSRFWSLRQVLLLSTNIPKSLPRETACIKELSRRCQPSSGVRLPVASSICTGNSARGCVSLPRVLFISNAFATGMSPSLSLRIIPGLAHRCRGILSEFARLRERTQRDRSHDVYVFYFAENAHNYYLQIAAETGLTGLLLFLGFLGCLLSKKSLKLTDPVKVGCGIALVALLIFCIGQHPLLVDRVFFAFVMVCAVVDGGAQDPPSEADRKRVAQYS